MPDSKKAYKIRIQKDGPYLVSGGVPLGEAIITAEGNVHVFKAGRAFPASEEYELCRCGGSSKKPFCDGSHQSSGFTGTELASRLPYRERAALQVGPTLDLLDDQRCAFARFCHRDGQNAWELTDTSDRADNREEAIKASLECPSGRLTPLEKTGKAVSEIKHEPSIEVMQDPGMGVSGGLFVKGNIPIESADGEAYELRNRVVLCRCGKSANMPFCDSSHVTCLFQDEL